MVEMTEKTKLRNAGINKENGVKNEETASVQANT